MKLVKLDLVELMKFTNDDLTPLQIDALKELNNKVNTSPKMAEYQNFIESTLGRFNLGVSYMICDYFILWTTDREIDQNILLTLTEDRPVMIYNPNYLDNVSEEDLVFTQAPALISTMAIFNDTFKPYESKQSEEEFGEMVTGLVWGNPKDEETFYTAPWTQPFLINEKGDHREYLDKCIKHALMEGCTDATVN